MQILAGAEWSKVASLVKGYATDDDKTKEVMADVFAGTGYIMCPHTAVGYDGLMQYQAENSGDYMGVVLSTAHYAKFLPTVEAVLGQRVPVPQRLADLLDLQKKSVRLGTDFEGFKAYLLA